MITGEAFQEKCLLWERGASVGTDFHPFNFQDLLHAQEPSVYKILEERKREKRHNRSLILCIKSVSALHLS